MENGKFYIYNKYTHNFEPINAEPVLIENHQNFEFFVHISSDNITWNVTEAISGSTVCVAFITDKKAIDFAKHKLSKITSEKLLGIIKDKVEVYGISPRYLTRVLPC